LKKLEKDKGRLAAKIEALLEKTDRDEHARCAEVTRLARSSLTPVAGVPVVPLPAPVAIGIPGVVDAGRDIVTSGVTDVRVPRACFLVLLHPVAERIIRPDGWVHSHELGAKDDHGWKGISRLRDATRPYLPRSDRIDENDRGGRYRLHPGVVVG